MSATDKQSELPLSRTAILFHYWEEGGNAASKKTERAEGGGEKFLYGDEFPVDKGRRASNL